MPMAQPERAAYEAAASLPLRIGRRTTRGIDKAESAEWLVRIEIE
jgi:hypothetical protein